MIVERNNTVSAAAEGSSPQRTAFVFFGRADDPSFERKLKKISRSLTGSLAVYGMSFVPSRTEAGSVFQHAGIKRIHITYVDLQERYAHLGAKCHAGADWTIIPGNLDLVQMFCADAFPGHPYYWFAEDDVAYNGDLASLINSLATDPSDVIATNRRAIPPNWWHRQYLKLPEKSAVSFEESIFLPFFRVSARFLAHLKQQYESGLSGHHEATWVWAVDEGGFSYADLNTAAGREVYTAQSRSIDLSPGSFVYRPVKILPGLRRNTLYHPVKGIRECVRDVRMRCQRARRRKSQSNSAS